MTLVIMNGMGDVWHEKVNFVDTDNVVLGYDTSVQCCEQAGWFISDTPIRDGSFWTELDELQVDMVKGTPVVMKNYSFDPTFMETLNGDSCGCDSGGMAIFRIVYKNNKIQGQKFLHIYNAHNGWYSHGFHFTVDTAKPIKGSL